MSDRDVSVVNLLLLHERNLDKDIGQRKEDFKDKISENFLFLISPFLFRYLFSS